MIFRWPLRVTRVIQLERIGLHELHDHTRALLRPPLVSFISLSPAFLQGGILRAYVQHVLSAGTKPTGSRVFTTREFNPFSFSCPERILGL